MTGISALCPSLGTGTAHERGRSYAIRGLNFSTGMVAPRKMRILSSSITTPMDSHTPLRTLVADIFLTRGFGKLLATVIAYTVFSPILAQNIVFTNQTDCDYEVKVRYGDISECHRCYGGPSYFCVLTQAYVANCCVCENCDCNVPGVYSCGPSSYAIIYPVAANSTVSFSPPATVCRFDILDTNTPQNVLHICSCHETECICHWEIECGDETVVIDVTPGWSIKWTYP